MTKQIKCECTRIMCLAFSMKINNNAQNKHENSFFIKTKHTSRYIYDLFNPNNTHTYPKHKRVYQMYLHEGNRLTCIHVYLLDLN